MSTVILKITQKHAQGHKTVEKDIKKTIETKTSNELNC